MATEYAGSGDLIRSVELLWGVERVKRGPRPQLTVDQIAREAIALADEEGFEGLSMRRMAERLGVGAMSLYRYVPSKAELLDLMVDRVNCETDRAPSRRGWRARLEHIAWENRRLYERHPWLLQVFASRLMGPCVFEKYDYELRALDGIGLSDVEMDLVLTLVVGYVRGAVHNVVEARRLRERTGMDEVEWWNTVSPALERIVDAERFPVAGRVGETSAIYYMGQYEPERGEPTVALDELQFDFGLQRVLDGVESLIKSKSGSVTQRSRRTPAKRKVRRPSAAARSGPRTS